MIIFGEDEVMCVTGQLLSDVTLYNDKSGQSVSFQESNCAVSFLIQALWSGLRQNLPPPACGAAYKSMVSFLYGNISSPDRERNNLWLTVLMLGKTQELPFFIAEYVLTSNIADKSGLLKSGILNMASPETQKTLQLLQFPLGIIILKTLFSYHFHSACYIDIG